MNFKLCLVFIMILFLCPIILHQYFSTTPHQVSSKEQDDKPKQKEQLVYDGNVIAPVTTATTKPQKKALLLFTHSHEAFEPIAENKTGLKAVYHSTTNITDFSETLSSQFKINSISTDFVEVETTSELNRLNLDYGKACDVIRPYLKDSIQKSNYDIIIDLHRDSAKRKIITLKIENETYAKVYFVVGEKHQNFAENKRFAEHLSTHMNELVPEISRGVIGKKGESEDGVYNQDLQGNMVLIELGGIESTEEEVNRTISVLAKAVSTVLQETPH